MKRSFLAASVLMLVLLAPAAAQEDPLDVQTREIAKGLQCRVCKNLSVADSNAELAIDFRKIIREKLQAGESRQQIEAYFVERYGEGILIKPRKRGFGLLLWLWPPIVLLGAALIVASATRRWVRPSPAEAREPTAEEMARYETLVQSDMEGLQGGAR